MFFKNPPYFTISDNNQKVICIWLRVWNSKCGTKFQFFRKIMSSNLTVITFMGVTTHTLYLTVLFNYCASLTKKLYNLSHHLITAELSPLMDKHDVDPLVSQHSVNVQRTVVRGC